MSGVWFDVYEGIVYNIDRDRQFAFFKNSENPQGVYFRIYPYLEKIQIGSVVVFDKIIVTSNGKRANRIISFSWLPLRFQKINLKM